MPPRKSNVSQTSALGGGGGDEGTPVKEKEKEREGINIEVRIAGWLAGYWFFFFCLSCFTYVRTYGRLAGRVAHWVLFFCCCCRRRQMP